MNNRTLKISLFTIATSLLLFAIVLSNSNKRPIVILSTNDMHAQLDKYPLLATAIERCRDTAEVILVDAGDRWTGNAFVDLVEHYTPMYEMMNTVGYDVAIYGNHEFDKGQAYVAVANRQAEFPVICANVVSDTTAFPQPAPHVIVERNGKKIAFVGIVGNYDSNNHPAGKDESFAGLTFTDPHTSAGEYSYLADECDMVVLVSHCGLERDVEFAQSSFSKGYDQIISAHSHDKANEVVNGKLITQTGSRLANIGATHVTINNGEVTLSYKNIPLSDYTPDDDMAQMVAQYKNNPELNARIGSAAEEFNVIAMRNLFAETLRKHMKSDIGLYHRGGVRIASMPQGDINLVTVLNAEPFNSYIALATMNVAQLRKLIMVKFNDKVNVGESHGIDIITTVPYTIITDKESGDATDVIFPTLDEKKSYTVALGDYIYKTYAGFSCSKGAISEELVAGALENYIKGSEAITPNGQSLQSITSDPLPEEVK